MWLRSAFVQDSLHWGRVLLEQNGYRYCELDLYSARQEITGIWEYRLHIGLGSAYENRPLNWGTSDVKYLYAPAGYGEDSWNLLPSHLGRYDSDRSDQIGSIRMRDTFIYWRIPYWLLFVLFALAPMFAGVRFFRARRRRARGLCSVCGYDLRSSPERCPECGTPVTLITAPSPATAKTPSPRSPPP